MGTNNLISNPTLIDIFKFESPNGDLYPVVNELTEQNEILQHMVWMAANSRDQHKGTRVDGLPTTYNKRLGTGTLPSGGSHVQYIEETKVRESWLRIEDRELQKAKNPEAYYQAQLKLHLQAMQQDMVQEIIYGNRNTTPDEINGLALRMPSLQSNRALGKVVSAAGASNANSSIWGIKWDTAEGLFMIYPDDHPTAGIDVEIFPAENETDANGKKMRVIPSRITWAYGIALANRRAIFRLANIDASISDANWILNVENKLVELTNDCPNNGYGYRFYGNTFIKTKFDIRAKDKANVLMSPMDPYNRRNQETTMFGRNPVHTVERLLATEANVS